MKNMQRRISIDDVERVIRERDPDEHPVVTSNYVADQTGVSRPTALSRLEDAHEKGRVKKSEISQASVWWLTDEQITEPSASKHPNEGVKRAASAAGSGGERGKSDYAYKCPNCGGEFDDWEHPFGGAAACPFCLKEQGEYE